MIFAPTRHKHPSSGANWPSDVAVTVIINTEYNMRALWWLLTPRSNTFQGILSPSIVTSDSDLESSMVYTVLPCFFESLPGSSNRRLSYLLLHMYAEEIIPAFLTSNIYIRPCFVKALTLIWLWSYKLFRNNECVGHQVTFSFPMLCEPFPHQLARGIPLKEGVPLPLQSLVRSPSPYLCWTIPTWQISLNRWLPPHPLYSDDQRLLQPPSCKQAVVAHQHLEERHRQTQHDMLYPPSHLAMLALPLL